jgi:hypothetical protein
MGVISPISTKGKHQRVKFGDATAGVSFYAPFDLPRMTWRSLRRRSNASTLSVYSWRRGAATYVQYVTKSSPGDG